MATRTPRAAVERRIKLLQALLSGPFNENKAELGRRLGYRDGSLIGQFLREERPITEATELKMLGLPEAKTLHLQIGGRVFELAQSLSEQVPYPAPPKSWEEVMHRDLMPEWPTEIVLVVPDRALEPRVRRGDHLTFQACAEAEPTSVVVIEVPDGRRFVRRLVMLADGSLKAGIAKEQEDSFPEFTEFKVLAKATRRSEEFTGF